MTVFRRKGAPAPVAIAAETVPEIPESPLASALVDLMAAGPNAAAERLMRDPSALPGLGRLVRQSAIATALHCWEAADRAPSDALVPLGVARWGPQHSQGAAPGRPSALRALPSWPGGGAAIGLLTDLQGSLAGALVWSVLLPGRAGFAEPPIVLGTALGCVLRLDEVTNTSLMVTTTLTAARLALEAFAHPLPPIWLVPDEESFASFEPPPHVTRVIFCSMDDPSPAMTMAAERIGSERSGRHVRMVDLSPILADADA